jgi:hypothetical protein
LQKSHMLTPKGEQGRAEPVMHGEGNRSGREPETAVKNSSV